MELENIVANTVYLKAREGESRFAVIYSYNRPVRFQILHLYIYPRELSISLIYDTQISMQIIKHKII